MPASDIVIKGAREHNLRDVSLVLPRNQLICLTGVSGSGKSSLAFDTVYAEGQRRFLETLGLLPASMVIELTEDYPTLDFRLVHESLMIYRAMGFRVAIDDLGTAFYAGITNGPLQGQFAIPGQVVFSKIGIGCRVIFFYNLFSILPRNHYN